MSATEIITYTGRRFDPMCPRAGDVELVDIAWHLANVCRFSGATRRFYSVAEHSVRVSAALDDPVDARWGLMHDAAEAYLCDIPRPWKSKVFVLVKTDLLDPVTDAPLQGDELVRFADAERRILDAIRERFEHWLPGEIPEAVHDADHRMLATEVRDLMRRSPAAWAELPPPYDVTLAECWYPDDACRAFLDRWSALTHGWE